MSRLTLIRAWPRDPATGAETAVRLAGGGAGAYYHGGMHYRAGVVREPRFQASLGFEERGWTGGVVPTVTPVQFIPAEPELLDEISGLYWTDARLEIDCGEEGGILSRKLTGTAASISIRDGQMTITAADLSRALAKPLTPDTFTGSGGIEGDASAEGRVKRRSWGRVFNVEGRLLDPAYNIYEFGDPARPLQGCAAMRDKGRDGSLQILPWQGSINATLAALRAAAVPQGGGIFAPSIALGRWWTVPSGPLTADLLGEIGAGYTETGPGIVAAISAAMGGPTVANLAEAVGWRAAACGWHADQPGDTAAGAIDALLAGLSLLWVLNPAGTIRIEQWSWTGAAEAVSGIYLGRERQFAPHRERRLLYRRNQRPHSDGEIASVIDEGVSIGANLVINSEFTNGLAGHSAGWDGDAGLPVARGLNLAGWSGIKNVAYAAAAGTPAAGTVFDAHYTLGGGWTLANAKRWAIPVTAGERLYYSALVAGHRCGARAILVFLDANGAWLTEDHSPTAPFADGASNDFANGDPLRATRVGAFVTVPAGARFAVQNIRGVCPGGLADPYIFHSDSFIAKVDPNQTIAPPYAPGPGDRRADVTGENTAANTAAVGTKPAAQLLADVNQAQSDATIGKANAASALGLIGTIVDDDYLDRSEKPAVVAQWTAIADEQPILQARADAFGISSERATYDGAVSALAGYLSALSPAWNDASQDTAIVRATFNGRFTDVYYARQLLLDRIAVVAAAAGTGNLLIDPLTLAPYVTVNPTVVREDTGAGGPVRDRYRLRLDSDNAYCYLQSTPIAVRPGEKIFAEMMFYNSGAPGASYAVLGCHWLDSAGAFIVGELEHFAAHAGTSPAGWTKRSGTLTVPASAATMKPYFYRGGGAGGYYHGSEPYIGRQQAGADVTGSNTAANTAAVGSTPATTVESGVNAANAGVNADGTIKTDRVGTGAVVPSAITGWGYVERNNSPINFPAFPARQGIMYQAFTKQLDGSVLNFVAQLSFSATAVIAGKIFLIVAAAVGGAVLGEKIHELKLDSDGNNNVRISGMFGAFFSGLPAGNYNCFVEFQRTDYHDCLSDSFNYFLIEERKR